MHYHLAPAKKRFILDNQKLLGFLCLAVFLGLMVKIWLPFAAAAASASAIQFLPADWSRPEGDASLPAVGTVNQENKIIIDTANLYIEAPIVEGVTPDDLLRGVGHDPESVKPGSQGRVVLSGHRFFPKASKYATVFYALDKLVIGDKITIIYNNQYFRYTVNRRWDGPKDKAVEQLTPTTAPILSIYTCGPTPFSAKGRIIFDAVLDESQLQQDSQKALNALQEGIL